MAEKIKKHKKIFFVLGIGLVLTMAGILGMVGIIALPGPVLADVQRQVAVTATVQEWLTFTLSTSSVVLLPDLIDSVGVTNIASSSVIAINLGTNSPDGWSISATGTNNGLKSGGNTIATPAVGTTCTALSDGSLNCYGVQAATTSATGVNIASMYKVATGFASNVVGSVRSDQSQAFASSTAQFADNTNVIDMKVKASCLATQAPADNYADTIYLTAIASIP